jgi:hypothetical protein
MAQKLRVQYPGQRPGWLRVDRLLGEWGIPTDTPAGRREFAGRVEARRRADGAGGCEPAAWYWGSEEFRQELLAQVSEQAGPQHTGEDIRECGQAKAEGMLREELARLGWADQDLRGHRKGDGRKVRIAARLRRETTMTLAWIAKRLQMGAPGHVAGLLDRNNQEAGGSENKLF